MAQQAAAIPFDEIVAGASARMTVIENVQYLSARDVIMHLGGKNAKTANKTWERLQESRKLELETDCRQYKFPGQGQSEQPVLTFKGALKLVMWIGGENAKNYRSAMVKILQKYYAGDGSLLEEVEANAVLIPADEELVLLFKKRRIELDIAKQETEVEARRLANVTVELTNNGIKHTNRAAELANTTTEREHIKDVTSNYRGLCEDKLMDERARLILKDSFLNMAIMQVPAAGAGSVSLANSKPISLSMVAHELGMKIPSNELISVGLELKKRYVKMHEKDPQKHEQLCGGRATMVNTYMDADKPLLEEVLKWHAAGRPIA